jgi:hypothetical protein
MPVDPTANGGYVVAAYTVTAVILIGYAVVLWARSKNLRFPIRWF